MELSAVAIVPGFCRHGSDLRWRLDLADARERFRQYGTLERKLRVITGVLVVAATATPEIRASRHNAFRCSLAHFDESGPHQIRLVSGRFHHGVLSRQHEWC